MNCEPFSSATADKHGTYFYTSPYAQSRMWTLEPGEGEKQVCAIVGYDPDPDDNKLIFQRKRCEARIMVGTAPTPTPAPLSAWVKLKNTSFYSKNPLSSNIPQMPISYDGDDMPANTSFIRDQGGLVAAPSLNFGSGTANANGWSASYTSS